MSTYLLVDLLAFIFPFLLSFDKKVHFYTQWKFLFPAVFMTMLLFIPWDILFTLNGVWKFNEIHLLGVNIFHIPVEEWLFFIVVPYASVFTYEVLNTYIREDYLARYSAGISITLIAILLIIGVFNFGKVYTSITFFLASLAVFIVQFLLKSTFMGRFYLAYLVILIPFFMVNGILTGSFVEQEVVWYNNEENLSVRLFTIPIEDAAYGLLLVLMNVGFYEFFRKKFQPSGAGRSGIKSDI